mmetsp:Transcript_65457/g.211040  ORF Transcript_65457/g.211040 Transcript_65457/m.211040 type:complete len:203 (+) Transcript_65457:153-761(+)
MNRAAGDVCGPWPENLTSVPEQHHASAMAICMAWVSYPWRPFVQQQAQSGFACSSNPACYPHSVALSGQCNVWSPGIATHPLPKPPNHLPAALSNPHGLHVAEQSRSSPQARASRSCVLKCTSPRPALTCQRLPVGNGSKATAVVLRRTVTTNTAKLLTTGLPAPAHRGSLEVHCAANYQVFAWVRRGFEAGTEPRASRQAS